MKKFAIGFALTLAMLSSAAFAAHPNIGAAHEDVKQALEKLHAAQVANGYDMAGHAAKAETLLREAEMELREARQAANENMKKNKK